MINNLAPIALFAFDRPEHLRATIANLQSNPLAKESDLYVFCDGPKPESDDKRRKNIDSVRRFVLEIQGFRSVTLQFKDENMGLAKSLISGIDEVLKTHSKIIVLEDDILVAPCFLEYMNYYLTAYAENKTVASIHGYSPPIQGLPELFFLRGADCWGWSTWKDRWQGLNRSPTELMAGLIQRNLTNQFDLDGGYPYTRMLQERIDGKNNSWAILWHASMFLENRFTLYPGQTLAENIGHDGSGTHSLNEKIKLRPIQNLTDFPRRVEKDIQEDLQARILFAKFYAKNSSPQGLMAKLKKIAQGLF